MTLTVPSTTTKMDHFDVKEQSAGKRDAGTGPRVSVIIPSYNHERFVAKLKEIGYRNPLNIEREGVPDHQQKLRDIKMGVGLLERLLG